MKAALVLLALTAVPTWAADLCAPVKPWLAIVSAPLPDTPKGRDAADLAEWHARQAGARELFTEFFAGRSDFNGLDMCLNGVDGRANFYSSVYDAFRLGTLGYLKQSHQPTIMRLVQLIEDQNAKGRLNSTRVTGHVFGPSPADLRAGFQRASGAVFMDISRISANEWPVVFAHEMLHGLDQDMYSAVEIQSEEWRWKLSTSQDPKDKAEFRKWIEASLNLGLWGEYRAWYYTVKIYQEGLAEGLWHKIDWIETAFPPQADFARQIYDGLDHNFTDPVDGFFSRPEVAAALVQARRDVRSPNPPPPLGFLRTLFGP